MCMKRPELVAFGENIRSLREQKELSQERLAELAELHRTYVGAVERGERNVSLKNIVRLAKALEKEAKDLLKGVK
jgi:transcriptional regulator with XRE-family HTH domain